LTRFGANEKAHMDDLTAISQARVAGRAIFAAAAYLIGVGLIFLLERIGAPDGLVRVLGPVLVLGAVVLIGALLRTTRIAAFCTADHAGSPRYGGAAFAAIAAGLVVSADQGTGVDTPRLAALAAGFFLAAVVIGPLARRTGASSLCDLLAARFNSRLLRFVLALAYFGIGVLIAAAGYEVAADALPSLLGVSRDGAIGAIGLIIVLIVAPGGLAGLLWVAAAAAGVMALVLFLPIGLRVIADASSGAPLLGGGAEIAASIARALAERAGASPAHGLNEAAIALGAAILPPLSTGAFASQSGLQATRAGIFGATLAALFALAFAVGAPFWPAHVSAAAQSLHASALLISALVCAAAGVHTASRATSADSAYGYESVLASRRLARSRGLALLAVAIGAALTLKRAIEPAEALLLATALSLALLGPPLALAVSSRARAADATAALLASVAVMTGLAWANDWTLPLARAPAFAMTGAAAGFTIGWAASLFGGSRRGVEAAPQRLSIESPSDPGP
jgi:Na+/proline symporter